MTYVDGFVLAVPADKKEIYRKHAAEAAPLFKEFGATRMVECWGDDVPDGKLTDFRGAVKGQDDEVVHVGLGSARTADVEITWPDGTKTRHPKLGVGAVHVLRRQG